jgi:hypothetical protein
MALPLQNIVKRAADLAWSVFAELTRLGTYKHISGYVYDAATGVNTTTVQSANVTMLITLYQSSEVDGANVKYGDEKVLVRASEMTSITDAVPGDWIESDGKRFDVKAVLKDASQQIFIFQTRREVLDLTDTFTTFADWGDLSAATSSEDWGNLELHTSSEDWN